ncbi:hypothetical protein SAMN04487768_0674 [Burkholderia sp. b13]|nr:hypothetical protein SAMN04487768_0674 [Burkholderia sp. b13]
MLPALWCCGVAWLKAAAAAPRAVGGMAATGTVLLCTVAAWAVRAHWSDCSELGKHLLAGSAAVGLPSWHGLLWA